MWLKSSRREGREVEDEVGEVGRAGSSWLICQRKPFVFDVDCDKKSLDSVQRNYLKFPLAVRGGSIGVQQKDKQVELVRRLLRWQLREGWGHRRNQGVNVYHVRLRRGCELGG